MATTSNPLTEVIPAAYRRVVYVVAAAALFIYGLYEVSAGDIRTFVISLVSALVSGLAASNTAPKPVGHDDLDDYGFDDESY